MGLVAKYGVPGTTTSRIATMCGVSEATLYRHFATRNDILVATLDLVYERIFKLIHAADQESALERLRAIGRFHSAILSSEIEGFVYPLFEFVAAPPELGLREPLAEHQRAAIRTLATIVDEGKDQGVVRSEVDSEQVAWELVGVYWAQDIAYLMGLTEFAAAGRGQETLERILDSISTTGSSKGLTI